MIELSGERRPIGWWLKMADARIEQAFNEAFKGQSISRREWQVLEPVSRGSLHEYELVQQLEAFEGVQEAVDELRQRGLISDGADGLLVLTDAGRIAHSGALAGVVTVRSAVSAALPGENYAVLLQLLADLVEGMDPTSKSSLRPLS